MKSIFSLIAVGVASMFLFFQCTSKDNSSIHKLTEVNYEDFNRYIGSATGGVKQEYDTITEDRNLRLLDTVKVYFNNSIVNTLANSNQVSFEFMDDNIMRYVDYNSGKQILSNRLDRQDSIFVIKKDSVDTPVFVVRNNDSAEYSYFRTLSAFRIQYNQTDSMAVVQDTLLNEQLILSKFGFSDIGQLQKNDTLTWVNVYYFYK